MKCRLLLVLCAYLLSVGVALADDKSSCEAGNGTFITGVVVKAPTFAKAKESRSGVQLSHTHITVKADSDNMMYDVAIDNIFASDYVKNSPTIPPSLKAIQVADRVELCGQTYTNPLGIHWVHTACGNTPTPNSPDGWLKIVQEGQVGENLEARQTYCSLWPSMKGHAFK